MPTIKPRVTITLHPQLHDLISRYARLQGRTRGAVIAELLDSIANPLASTLDSLVDQRKALAPLGRAFCVGASPAGAPAKPGACAFTLRS